MDKLNESLEKLDKRVISQLREDLQNKKDSKVAWEDLYWSLNDIYEKKIRIMQSELDYYKLYIEFLVGSITEHEFKKRAVIFATPLAIDASMAMAPKKGS